MADEMNGEREAFESWAISSGFPIRRLHNPEAGRDYGIDDAQDAWEAWQARASLAANAPAATAADGKWYMVNKVGMATLCADQADAEQGAKEAQTLWPHMEPHRVVQLVEAGHESAAANAGSEPVAWPKDAAEVREFFNSDFISAKFAAPDGSPCDEDRYYISAHDFLSAINWWADFPHHPSPPEGMAGWTKASEQLPPCRDDQDYIGINTAGFAGVFNAVADIAGNVYCMMETAEESVSIMSDLDIWKPFIRPLPASPTIDGESNGS